MNRSLAKTHQSSVLHPWSDFRNEVWDIFDRFSKELDTPALNTQSFMPRIEFKDGEKGYQVCVEVPGMNKEDIHLSLNDNQLIIEGEKKNQTESGDKSKGTYPSEFSYGRFYRAIPLPDDVDAKDVKAAYKDGVLKIELMKNPERSRTRKIEIGMAEDEAKLDQKH